MAENTLILITGGAGYIGSHVNKALSRAGYQTLVFDNLSTGHKELVRWGTYIEAELHDKHQLEAIFSRHRISAVIHLAGSAYVGESMIDPGKYYENNVCTTVNLLNAMHSHNVDAIIFSSSCATYGIPEQLPITEKTPQKPINPYGRTKFVIEQMLQDNAAAYGLRYVNLRYFNAAGADSDGDVGEWHLPETHLIPNVLNVAAGSLDSITIHGNDYPTSDGTCIRDYIHVSDLADAHLKALQYLLNDKQSNDSFNLGCGTGYSVLEIIRKTEEITGRNIMMRVAERRQGDPPILTSDSTKANKILKWHPLMSDMNTIIRTSWDWHQKLDGMVLK